MLRTTSLMCLAVLVCCCGAVAQDTAPAPAAPAETPASADAPAPAAPAEAPAHPLEGLWELRMERTLWWPYLVPGSLVVSRGPNGLRASLTFDPMWGIDPKRLTVEPVSGETVRLTLFLVGEEPIAIVEGTVKDGVFVGQIDWKGAKPPEKCFISASRLAPLRRLEVDSQGGPLRLASDPGSVGIDAASLDRLILYAGRYDTDSLVVVKDGSIVCDRTFLRPRCTCETDIVTQAVASLAIPLLVEDGKLPRELDTQLSTWFPAWKTDATKSKITLRHVLTHSTGLAQYDRDSVNGDYVAAAVAAAAVREPGERCEYNSQAIELLSGVVAKAAGEPIDTYLERRLLRPLGIGRCRWPRDDAGNAPAYGALYLSGPDLARVGSLLADGGRWQGKQLVPKWWIDEMLVPSATNEEMGLVWNLVRDPAKETVFQTQAKLDRLKQYGFVDTARLAPLVGKSFESRGAWWQAVKGILGEAGAKALHERLPYDAVGGELRGPVEWAYLRGSNGQCVVVSPERRLAVARLRRPFAENELPEDVKQRAGFHDLVALVRDLTW
jgi:CubicO group peptidase (beta-lactamase class C family)